MSNVINFNILKPYVPLFVRDPKKPFFVITGSRASGKNYHVVSLFIQKMLEPEYFKGVIARYTSRSLLSGIYDDFRLRIKEWGLEDILKLQGDRIINIQNGNTIITHAFKIADGAMTAKGKGISSPTALIVDEAQELPSESEYDKMIGSFRTPGSEPLFFLLLNPTSKRHWIFKRFFLPDSTPNYVKFPNHVFIHTTYKDNPYLPEFYLEEINRKELYAPNEYKHEYLGIWRDAYEGAIFDNWDFSYDPPEEGYTVYGLDFGFQDPNACVKVTVRGNEVWIKEMLYKGGITNPEIYSLLIQQGLDNRSLITADSANPKDIEDLRRLGLSRIRKARKGKDSIINGIKKIKGLTVHIDPTSHNLIEEYECYTWSPEIDKPGDKFNHLMDAIRYALEEDKPRAISSYSGKDHFKNKWKNEDSDLYTGW